MNPSAAAQKNQKTQKTHQAQTGQARHWWSVARRFNTVAILIVLVIAASFVSGDFFSVANLSNISRQVAGVGIMSVGMLLVVLTGGIDLSVGSIAALGSVVSAMLIPQYGLSVALLVTLLVGGVCGFVSGALIAWFRLTPFV
ncbi:MAG: ribose transport system permease protein, partial [Caballeronia sp.]|nr:ribose transport system permease protein [Caballeronia sp.]